ncbi:MAG: SRPBCC family protein [Acidobacteriota bacterium]|nr:SRPBCC family protein [Acidobacteriota bacterium]
MPNSTRPESLQNGNANGNERGQSLVKSVNEAQLARGLGWFSIGLGLAELLAPRGVARVSGMRRGNTGLIRLFGLREIASGVAILSTGGRSAGAVWSRVVGDALDLACLGAAFANPDNDTGKLLFATANVAGVTALDVLAAQRLTQTGGEGAEERGAKHVTKSIVIDSTPEELYQFWHDFERLPEFMRHLESVRTTGEGRSHWRAKGPAGSTVEWDAEITEDRPNELIAWRSVEGSEVYNAGAVRFEQATGKRGAIVTVDMDYTPPGGLVGVVVAKLFGEEPDGQLQEDLRRFKQVIELGEVVLSDATLQGAGYTEQRPAQPVGEASAQ